MLEKIKPLHGLGFSILWIMPKSKRPVEKDWTKLPPKSWDALKLSHKENFNAGVRLGSNSKLTNGNYLAVIDCDVKSEDPVHQKEMEKALDALGFEWAHAPTVMSGRGNGSRHIYVQTEEPLAPFRLARSHHAVKVHMPSVTKFSKKEEEELSVEEMSEGWHIRPAWEIGAMGTGQQVVLPPSIHPDSGLAYKWSKEIVGVKSLPVVTLSRDNIEQVRVIKDAPEFSEIVVDLVSAQIPLWCYEMIVHGKHLERYDMDRSAALYSAAMCLINAGFTDGEIMTVLTDPDYELSWVAYEHRKTKDRKSAAQWVYKYTIAKARHEKSAQKAFEGSAEITDTVLDEKGVKAQQEDMFEKGWRDTKLDRNQFYVIKNTLKNVVTILTMYPDRNIFYYDDFYHAEYYSSTPPWGEKEMKWDDKQIIDIDLIKIKMWFAKEWGFEPSLETIATAISFVADKSKIHPVRDYLKNLEWDGTPRLNTWLRTYMKAEGPEEYLSAVGAKLLVACVARIFEPGCKWDYVVIFEGKQGIGKSTACSILGGEWFTDTLGDIANKDVVDTMRGKWVIEIGELAVMRKHEVESLKHFITVRTDTVRKAFARKSEDYPRQCVFIGTTNRSDYLKDETGNRRFFPVKVHVVNFDKLIADRDQLWAEAFERWVDGEKLYLEKDVEKIAAEIQSSRMEHDEWESIIQDVFDKTDDSGPLFPSTDFRMLDLWIQMSKLSDLDGMKFNNQQQHRVGRILRMMGFEMRVIKIKGKTERRWFRKEENE